MSPDLIIPIAILGAVAVYALQRRPGVAFSIAIAVIVAATVMIVLAPDGWSSTILGTDLAVTPLSRFLLVVTTGLAALVTIIGFAAGRDPSAEGVVLLVIAASVVASLSASEPLLSVFGLASAYLLVVFSGGSRGSDASGSAPGLDYVVMIGVSAVSLVLAFTLMQSYTVTRDAAMLRLIVPLLAVGLGILLAAFPLHFWLPLLFQRVSTQAVALVGLISTVQALGLLIQTLSRYPWLLLNSRGSDLLLMAGVAAVILCPIISLLHRPIARSLSYLLVGNVGFIFVGLALHTPSSIAGAIWICVTQAIAILALAVGIEALESATPDGERGSGVPFRLLGLMLIGVGALSVVGVPLLGSFPGKMLIYEDAASVSWWLLASMLGGSALAAVSLLRCIVLETRRGGTIEPDMSTMSKPMARPYLAAALGATLVAFLFGLAVYPAPLLAAISIALERLALVL